MLFLSLSALALLPAAILGEYSICGPERDDEFASPKLRKLRSQFDQFQTQYGKMYKDAAETQKRCNIFIDNMLEAAKRQAADLGTATFGMTPFSDLTREEFIQQQTGLKIPKNIKPLRPAKFPTNIDKLPDNFDWRKKGAVTPVKNQGGCGSCWTFSVTGVVEGHWAIKTGNLVSFSEQELVDCDTYDKGCGGGFMPDAYEWLMTVGGLEREKDYPYTAKEGSCNFNKDKISGYFNYSVGLPDDENLLAAYLVANGPISIAVAAGDMVSYKGGISHPSKADCPPDDLDHGVLIVGIGKEKGIPFWIIKNSWGTDWGEEGYYRVYRGDGCCGLNTYATSVVTE